MLLVLFVFKQIYPLNFGVNVSSLQCTLSIALHLLSIKVKSPYEILLGQTPIYSHIRIFGCLCYAHNRPRQKNKFGEQSQKCVFVGYPFGKKGWRLYDLENEDYFESCDVVFCENEFPFSTNVSNVQDDLNLLQKPCGMIALILLMK